MNTFTLTALSVALCFSLAIIKQIRPEYSSMASAVVCVALAAVALVNIYPLFEFFLTENLYKDFTGHLKTVVKAIGIALLCSVAIEICRDFGENAMAFGIELFCKCEIIAVSVPLITEVIEMAKDMLSNEI